MDASGISHQDLLLSEDIQKKQRTLWQILEKVESKITSILVEVAFLVVGPQSHELNARSVAMGRIHPLDISREYFAAVRVKCLIRMSRPQKFRSADRLDQTILENQTLPYKNLNNIAESSIP